MKTIKIPVLNTKGEKVGDLDLDPVIFDGKVKEPLMHQAIVSYLANQRKGLAAAKTRGDVSGGGAKPWRQKGTGRARVGSSRNPLWRGGGVAFGPKPHSFYKDFPKKMKAAALKSALNAKVKTENMIVLDALVLKSHKTAEFAEVLKNLKIEAQKVMLVVETLDKNLKLSSRNIEKVEITPVQTVNTYEALNCKKLIFTKDALTKIEARIKQSLGQRAVKNKLAPPQSGGETK